jgi:ribose/xylose/arabinose/galactoside ABC-type transport system permease subunit
MKQTRNFAEFWSSLFAEAQVTYLTFILLTLQTVTKLKTTTFGRNLLYWMHFNFSIKD